MIYIIKKGLCFIGIGINLLIFYTLILYGTNVYKKWIMAVWLMQQIMRKWLWEIFYEEKLVSCPMLSHFSKCLVLWHHTSVSTYDPLAILELGQMYESS